MDDQRSRGPDGISHLFLVLPGRNFLLHGKERLKTATSAVT
jgi:hypothetical protein